MDRKMIGLKLVSNSKGSILAYFCFILKCVFSPSGTLWSPEWIRSLRDGLKVEEDFGLTRRSCAGFGLERRISLNVSLIELMVMKVLLQCH